MNEIQVNAVVTELKGIIDGLTQRVMDLAGGFSLVSQQRDALQKEIEELKAQPKTKSKKPTQPKEGDLL